MPAELVAKLNRAAAFNAGFSTVEALASSIVDMKIHLAADPSIDPKKFEATTLAEIGMPREIVMRHRLPHFGHIFSGDGYAAGYYSYLWSEVLDQDAYEAFTETGNPYDPATAKRFHDSIMSVGNTVTRRPRSATSADATRRRRAAARSRVPGAQAVIPGGTTASNARFWVSGGRRRERGSRPGTRLDDAPHRDAGRRTPEPEIHAGDGHVGGTPPIPVSRPGPSFAPRPLSPTRRNANREHGPLT